MSDRAENMTAAKTNLVTGMKAIMTFGLIVDKKSITSDPQISQD